LRLLGCRGLFFAGEQDFEGVARLHFALEIDVVGVNADQVFDDGIRNVVAAGRLIDALV
jgi:hypothetical protein